MKFLVVAAALLAVASAAPGLSTVVAGPSGTIVSNPGYIARSGIIAPGLVAPGLLAPSVYSAGLVAPGLVAPGLLAPNVIAARSVIAPGLLAPSVLAAPGVTAGTVVAPGTTLVGPNTNGAPGAVITNSPYGTQILV